MEEAEVIFTLEDGRLNQAPQKAVAAHA
jgi:hypothetical protein